MKHFFLSILAVAAVLCTGSLSAERHHGWYVGATGGAGFQSDMSAGHTGILAPGTSTLTLDTGWMVAGAVGHMWDNGFAAEGEVSYRRNGAGTVTPTGGAAIAQGGNVNALGLMLNGYYNIEIDWFLQPYVGLGLGTARVKLANGTYGGVAMGTRTDWVFAYQAIGGFEYPIDDAWSVSLEYRFFGTSDPSWTAGGVGLSGEYHAHSIGAGLNFNF